MPDSTTLDSLGFVDAVAGLPEQLEVAHEAAATIDLSSLPKADDITNVVMLGMGGSAVAGDVVRALGGSLPFPITVQRGYRVPAFVGRQTLAFALSYSGDTEETLSMAQEAVKAGAHLVAVTSGGALEALAATENGTRFACPPGYMPRAALGALVAPLLVTLSRLGVYPEARALLVKAQEQLKRRRDQCSPAVEGTSNPARELARQLGRTIPLIYGGGGIGEVAAKRWKTEIHENAKAPAFANAYPELDHNEVCGWGQHGDVTRQVLSLVQLRHGFEHPQVSARMELTREIIEEAFVQVLEVEAAGEGRLAQLLDLMYVGTWTSCYLALDNDVDPGPIDAIARLKAALAKNPR